MSHKTDCLFILETNKGTSQKPSNEFSVLRTHVWVKIYKGSTPLQFSNAVDNVLPPLPPSLFLLVVIFFTGHGQAPGGGGSVQHPEAENVSSKYALGGFRPSRQRARVVAKLACFSTYTRDRPLQHPNAAIYLRIGESYLGLLRNCWKRLAHSTLPCFSDHPNRAGKGYSLDSRSFLVPRTENPFLYYSPRRPTHRPFSSLTLLTGGYTTL